MTPFVPHIPDTAPFTAGQRAWLNGFFAGVFSRSPVTTAASAAAPALPPATLTPLTILFGSQTGTAESLAKRAAKVAGQRGFAPTIVDMAQIDAVKLAAEQNLLVIASTYGDGEPPDNAKSLHTALASLVATSASETKTPLAALRFSVCSLGDTNYTQFCKCGQDFDAFLAKLGGTRALPREDCDLEYEAKFSAWLNAALTALATRAPSSELGVSSSELGHARVQLQTPNSELQTEPAFSKKNPFPALLLTSRNLNASGSAKQVQHVEFSLEGSGLTYEAGDALGVFPHNCPDLVAEVSAALGCDGEEAVPTPDGSTTSLRRALTELYDLGKPTADLVAALTPAIVGQVADLARPSTPVHVIDVLLAARDHRIAPADFIRALKQLQPRLYSISSSPRAHAGQVHLTVGAVRYDHARRARKGVCSTFLAERATAGTSRVGVYVHANKAFRPPASTDTPMIMVGPGTGVAPFRAFLHERRASGARGKNWLFFGDQRAATDFLYREELAELQRAGVLSRLDTAFSRDQAEKIYVQHRMLEHAAELYAWLEAGAHFYVCGDATRMAKDVDAALHAVVERAGQKTAAQAQEYVQALRTARRYARDVY